MNKLAHKYWSLEPKVIAFCIILQLSLTLEAQFKIIG